MKSPSGVALKMRAKPDVRLIVAAVAVLILIVAMAVDTKVVTIGSGADTRHGAFSPLDYGRAQFPKVQAAIEARAVDAATIASAVAKDPAAAGKQYGVPTGAGPEIAVKFTGRVGKQDFGIYDVKVDGLPDTQVIRVQTGPAINGTDLRDAAGTINFGQFTNQIDYQNAGSALNKEMKKQVLAKIDAGQLAGKTISVVGVFQLVNPRDWFVTPVKLDVR